MGNFDGAPPGFERHFRQSPVTDPWEPLWSRQGDGVFTLGLWIRPAHCNARGLLHGGVISALADNAMGLACANSLGGASGLLTVHLSVNFLEAAEIDRWLAVRAQPKKVGGSLAYADCDVVAEDRMIASASAVFKIIRRAP